MEILHNITLSVLCFLEGGGISKQNLSMGEVWIFYTKYHSVQNGISQRGRGIFKQNPSMRELLILDTCITTQYSVLDFQMGRGFPNKIPLPTEVWKFCIISHFQYSTFKRGGGFPNKAVRIFCRTTQCKTLDFPEGRGFPNKISLKEKC